MGINLLDFDPLLMIRANYLFLTDCLVKSFQGKRLPSVDYFLCFSLHFVADRTHKGGSLTQLQKHSNRLL